MCYMSAVIFQKWSFYNGLNRSEMEFVYVLVPSAPLTPMYSPVISAASYHLLRICRSELRVRENDVGVPSFSSFLGRDRETPIAKILNI